MSHIKGVRDSKGRLWFVGYSGRLSYYERGIFQVFEESDTFSYLLGKNNCISLFVDSNDIIHLGLKRNGYMQYDPRKKELITIVGPETHDYGLYVGRKGGKPFAFTLLPVADADTISRLPFFKYRMNPEIRSSTILGYFPEVKSITDLQDKMDVRLAERANGNILLSAKNFLLEVGKDTVRIDDTGVQMRSIVEDDYGGLWLANAEEKGVHYFPDGKYTHGTGQRLLADVHIHTALKDRYGGMWFGTRKSGLYYSGFQYVKRTLFPSTYSSIDSIFSLKDPIFFTGDQIGIFHAYDGQRTYTYRIEKGYGLINSVYYQKDSQKLYICNNDSLLVVSPGESQVIAHPEFYFMMPTGHIKEHNGSIWVSGGYCIFRLNGDSVIEEYPSLRQKIRDYCWFRDELYVATYTGVLKYKNGEWIDMKHVHDGFEGRSDHIRVFNDDLWVFNFQKGCFVFDGYSVRELQYSEGYTMRQIMGSEIRNDTFFFIGSNNCVSQVISDSATKEGYSWVNIPMPLPNPRLSIAQLYSIGQRLVFPINGYIYSYLGSDVRKIPHIKVVFKQVYFNGLPYASDTSYSKTHDSSSFSVSFGAISHHSGGAFAYKYRINPDQDWVYTQDKKADLYYLPPGSYKFEVFARNSFLQNSPIRSISITIRPPYYKTWWFQLSVAIVLVLMVWGLFKWRIGQVRKRGQLLEELHSSQHQSLAARMNPHFIFNSLSAIHQYTLSNNKEEAAEYMTEYAQLMRLVMDNAGRVLVELQSELEALEIYLKLERLRSKGKMDYALRLDPELDTGETFIPALLIWPYLENAIWHGLMPRQEGEGLLSVRFLKKGADLLVEVEDNGIGRHQAAALATGNHPGFESQGMNMTQQRIELIRKIYKVDIKVEVKDLYRSNGSSLGTLVQLSIPPFT